MSVLTPERSRSRLLVTFIGTGLAFMLIPGTFLGVWNLVQISGRESVSLVSPADRTLLPAIRKLVSAPMEEIDVCQRSVAIESSH